LYRAALFSSLWVAPVQRTDWPLADFVFLTALEKEVT